MSLVAQALIASSAAAAVVAAVLALRVWLEFRTSYIRWRIDADYALMPHGPEEFTHPYLIEGFGRGHAYRVASNPSVVVIRLRNSPVKSHHLKDGLVFTFPGREVIAAKVDAALRHLPATALDWDPSGGGREVVIREEFLSASNEFRLVVLLSGSGQGAEARGWLVGGRVVQERPEPFRPRRRLAFAATEAVLLCLAVGLPLASALAFSGRSFHLSGSWGWPVFVALMSLLLGVAGFAVGRALPRNYSLPPPPPASGWRALGRGYLDAVTLPWLRPPPSAPTPESAEPDLAAELRAVLTRLGADDV